MFVNPRVALRAAFLIPAVLIAAAPLSAQTPSRARIVAAVDSLAEAALRDGPVAGASIAVVKGRDTLVMKGYGLADVEHEVPATPQTVHRIGSITKQFTAAAILKLAEQGKLSLDDEATKYVPSLNTRGHRVLIRHLLNHTSGIRSYTSVGERWAKVRRLDMSPDSIMALVQADTFDFPTNTRWSYNNSGYMLLGMIIEKVSGKPYADYLQEEFFGPLGLTSTRYCATQPIIKHRAQGYAVERGKLVNAEFLSMTQPFSAGALCSTVGDLLAWNKALREGRIISTASYARMSTPDTLIGGQRLTYAYGLSAGTLGDHSMIVHGGGINGFITDMAHFPKDSLTVVVLMNTAPAPADAVSRNIARVVLGLPLPPPPKPAADLTLSPTERTAYVGKYEIQVPGQKLPARVFEEGGRLMIQVEGQSATRMMAQGAHLFALEADPSVKLQFKVDGGRATSFTLLQGPGFPAPRVP